MTHFLKTSIGKKLTMAITGLFLISFLLVHCSINALIFFNDGGTTFNAGAEFMAKNPVIRAMEIVLFLGIIMHIVQALQLTIANKKARPINYATPTGNSSSKWYARSMGLLGTLILMFLILHLKHFWIVSRFTNEFEGGKETLFTEMKEIFENPLIVLLYVLAMGSLAYHLMHGFQSAFQTLGWNHKKYTPLIKSFGVCFSIAIALVFASMPVVMYLGLIK